MQNWYGNQILFGKQLIFTKKSFWNKTLPY